MRALGKGSVASLVKAALDVARWVLWLAAAALALAFVTYLGLLAATTAHFADPALLAQLGGHIKVSGIELSPANPSWPLFAWGFAVGAVAIGGGIVIVGRLRRLFEGFSSGEPFRKEYATHLRVIWIAMLVVEVSRMVLGLLLSVGLAAFDRVPLDLRIRVDATAWVSILVLIVIAEVFREGARLREEQELTI